MTIQAAAAAASVEFQGRTYYFCTVRCREKFEEHPGWYVPLVEDGGNETGRRGDLGSERSER